MNIIKTLIFLSSFTLTIHAEESAIELAKRIITEKKELPFDSVTCPTIIERTIRSAPYHYSKEEKSRLDKLSKFIKHKQDSEQLMKSYMLSNDTPEKVQLAFALGILSKRIDFMLGGVSLSDWIEGTPHYNMQYNMDWKKYDQYIKYAETLHSRLIKIQSMEEK